MKIPFLPPVVPSHVFCLLADGVTWANVRREPVPGFVDSRHFPYPANTIGAGPTGTPLLSRDAIAAAFILVVNQLARLLQPRLVPRPLGDFAQAAAS